jgi:hypothetical protein
MVLQKAIQNGIGDGRIPNPGMLYGPPGSVN